MFVCNFKINKKSFLIVFMIITIILAVAIFVLSIDSIFKEAKIIKETNPEPLNNIVELDSNNYTSFLKDCHENIDNYVGYNIRVTGYIYRVPDFNQNQFVLARTMLYDSSNQAVVVGIMCDCDSINEYEDYTWVTIEGTIFKGDFHGDIPIVNISKITRSKMPENEFVFEPVD